MEDFASVQERRRYKRTESNLPIQYRDLRKTNEPLVVTTSKNISEGGVSFTSNQFISLACRLVMEINIPNEPKPLKAISKVAWIRKLPTGSQYQLGNQFLEMTKEDRVHIANFINDVLDVSTSI